MIKIGFLVSLVLCVLKWLGYISCLTWLECFVPLFGTIVCWLLLWLCALLAMGGVIYTLRDMENK